MNLTGGHFLMSMNVSLFFQFAQLTKVVSKLQAAARELRCLNFMHMVRKLF